MVKVDRILQITNDAAEGIRSGTREEWVAAAMYWRDANNAMWLELGKLRSSMIGLGLAADISPKAWGKIKLWFDRVTPNDQSQ